MRFLSSFEFYLQISTWKTCLFFWTWLSLLIICSDGVHGQDKQLMLLSQDALNPSLTSSSDLSQSLGTSNDILRIQTEEYFPKKLEKSFQKHRWKINKDFSISQIYDGETTSRPLVTVPNPFSGNVTHNQSALLVVPGDEDERNIGQEDTEEEDPAILHLMTTADVGDITRISSRLPFENVTTTEMPLELINPELLKVSTEEDIKTSSKEIQRPKKKKKSSDEERMNHVDIELLKINHNNVNKSSSSSNNKKHNNMFRPSHADEQVDTDRERLIPQLVNVTTENVYVSMESDETLEDSMMSPNNGDFPSTTNDPPVITVNASGIFPQTNLSSIWDRPHKSHKHSLLSSFPNTRQEQLDEDQNNASEVDEDSEEEKQEKTMMMKRRPRRSVVHLYDMVVCATGCNPLIYKGYGCFCGFMGSGITVDGIDKCCYKHDWCYHHAKCPPLLTYFVPYYWTCNGGHPKCVSDFRGWKGICGAHLCECDRQFAECLRKYPCPRTRAMCMTSPWRFWQNIVMPPPYYG